MEIIFSNKIVPVSICINNKKIIFFTKESIFICIDSYIRNKINIEWGKNMKKILFAILISTMLLGTVISVVDISNSMKKISVDKRTWISFYGSKPGEEPILNVLESSLEKTVIDVTLPGFWVTDVLIEGDFYQEIMIPEHSTTMDVGEPAVPIIRSLIAIPENCNIDSTFLINDKIKLDDFTLTVFEEPLTDNTHYQQRSKPRDIYPIKPDFVAQTTEPGIWRDIRIVTVEIAPISYNSLEHTLTITPHMTVELYYSYSHGGNPKYTDKAISPRFDQMYRNCIMNYDSLEIPIQSGNNVSKYLIISHPDFISAIQPLADWHQQEGFDTEVLSLTTTDYNTVKSEIVTRYNQGNLEYVLLVGDTSYMPIATWEGLYSDYYYACITGNPDYYADISVGRLSVQTSKDAENQVNKTLRYEKNPLLDTWLNKIILVAHKENAPGKYVGCKEEIRTGIIPKPPFIVNTAYGNHANGTNANVAQSINEGRNIVNYRGHGSTTAWTGWSYSSEYWDISDVNALTNENRTPIVFNIACTCQLITSSCLGEAWMSKYPGGAVASLGATDPSYTIPNHDYDKELFRQFTSKDEYRIGWMSNAAATLIINGHGSMGVDNAQMYLWLGDPATEVWTDIPGNVTVDYPPTIPYGQNIVEITVMSSNNTPAERAQVCIMQEDGCYASGYTNASGIVELELDVQDPEEATLTVSAHDHLPFITQIQIGDSLPPSPPTVEGPVGGKPGKEYEFTATATDPEGLEIFYLFDWGDGTSSDWLGPYNSGESAVASHAWSEEGNYKIKVRAKDVNDSTGYWSDPYLLQIRLPVLDIGLITGGLFKVTAEIENTGIAEAEEINWKIALDGGLILLGKETTGAIDTILAGEKENVTSKMILGFGQTQVVVTVDIPEGSKERDQGANILLFFIIVNPGG
jgi:hypothetical protein